MGEQTKPGGSADDSIASLLSAVARVERVPVAPGASIGRYQVLNLIGSGGMGAVYAAYDPKLDRRVALKLILPREGEAHAAERAGRFAREAKVLAQLSHPNVVAVFDVGSIDEQMFIAMEFVRGCTLRRYLQEKPRSVAEILSVFIQAGEGLAAAHAAGIVHRDFKPDNALVGDDGRVRVADFGLARSGEPALQTPSAGNARLSSPGETPHSLTGAGGLVGTPLYMAPEQVLQEPPTARSDQFSFCVALYEALCGQHPFAAENLPQLFAALEKGAAPQPPPRRANVPRRLFRILERGLQKDPAARHPSMDALVAELRRDPARTTRRALAAAAALVVLASAAGLTAHQVHRRHSLICKGAERKLDGVWDAARKQALAARFAKIGAPDGTKAAADAARALDRYAGRFVAAHTDACEAAQLRGEQSFAVLDLRMQCLEQRRQELSATVALLAQADPGMVENASGAVRQLTDLESCADVATLQQTLPLPADGAARARIASLRERIGQSRVLMRVNHTGEGLKQAEAIAAEAHAIGWAPLVAEAELVRGWLREDSGDLKGAEAAMQEAVFAAAAGKHDQIAMDAARSLAIDVGRAQDRPREGRVWLRLTEAILSRLGGDLNRYRYEQAAGLVDRGDGKNADAAAHYRRALELLGKANPDNRSKAEPELLNNLGGALLAQGKYAEADEAFRRALAGFEREYGPEHAALGDAMANLAQSARLRGRFAEAEAGSRRVLALYLRAFGPKHWRVGSVLSDLGWAVAAQGRLPEAEALFADALAVAIASKGAASSAAASARVGLGSVRLHQRRLAEARALLTEALHQQIEAVGPMHSKVVEALIQLGNLELAERKPAAARAWLERAREVAEKSAGGEHPDVAEALLGLAEAELMEGRQASAPPLIDRAERLWALAGGSPQAERLQRARELGAHRP